MLTSGTAESLAGKRGWDEGKCWDVERCKLWKDERKSKSTPVSVRTWLLSPVLHRARSVRPGHGLDHAPLGAAECDHAVVSLQLSLSCSFVWKWFCFIPDPPGTGTMQAGTGQPGQNWTIEPTEKPKGVAGVVNPFFSPTFSAFGFPGCGNSGTANMAQPQ